MPSFLVSNVICTVANDTHKVLFILYSTFAMSGVHNGTGQHSDVIPDDVLPVGLKVRKFSSARRESRLIPSVVVGKIGRAHV